MSRANGSYWLSPHGASRRDDILRLAQTEARRRRRRREITRKVGANVVFLVMSLITALVARMQMSDVFHSSSQALISTIPQSVAPVWSEATPGVQVSYIQTDPAILDRLSIRDESPRWQSIDDDELIRTFAEAGQQVGIIRFGGKTELMTR